MVVSGNMMYQMELMKSGGFNDSSNGFDTVSPYNDRLTWICVLLSFSSNSEEIMRTRNREFVMLAQDYEPAKHTISGWFMSEKYDGQRAIWLPWTRGMSVKDVPFANRARDNRDHTATGLWSRYGKVIHAPSRFIEQLPSDQIVDGELYMGRGGHQSLRSVVSTLVPGIGWDNVQFVVLDMPKREFFLTGGKVNNPNYSYTFPENMHNVKDYGFETKYDLMQITMKNVGPQLILAPQIRLPFVNAKETVEKELARITLSGGEGLVLRAPGSVWEPYRSHTVLKAKKLLDSEAQIIGFVAGKGKLLGMFGAMIVRWEGKEFELSGFTDSERELFSPEAKQFAIENPGKLIPGDNAKYFDLGDMVTFAYRELTDGGIPKEARYWRKRSDY